MIAAAAAGMAGLSMVSSYMQSKAQRKAADRARRAEILGAKKLYSSTENSINIMKAANREVTANLIQEALRAGAANSTTIKEDIKKVASSQVASNEGLTSGRSRGRALVSTYTKGNKLMSESKSETSSMINQLTDAKDKATADMNNQLIAAHQEMSTILTTPGAVYKQDPFAILNAGISGAASGASLASALG